MESKNKQNNQEELTIDDLIDPFFNKKSKEYRNQFKTNIDKLVQYSFEKEGNFQVECAQIYDYLDVLLIFDKDSFFPFLDQYTQQTPQLQRQSSINNSQLQNKKQKIQFRITVKNTYPLKGVRLFCQTFIAHPSISDGRDIMYDVLEKRWNNLTTFMEIVEKIPKFLEKIYGPKDDNFDLQKRYLQVQKIGRFYLGNNYQMQDLKQLKGVVIYPCVQEEPGFFQPTTNVRILLITDCHFVMFNADEKEEQHCKCIFVADIQSILKITRKKKQPQKITLQWKNYFYDTIITQELMMQYECEKLVKAILKRVPFFQKIKIDSNSYMNFGKTWVKEKKNIDRITAQIEVYESEIKHIFNQENVQQLIVLYNEAIEHYSAVGDILYDVFRNKLQCLLRRSDVQTLLSFNRTKSQSVDLSGKESTQSNTSTDQEESGIQRSKSLSEAPQALKEEQMRTRDSNQKEVDRIKQNFVVDDKVEEQEQQNQRDKENNQQEQAQEEDQKQQDEESKSKDESQQQQKNTNTEGQEQENNEQREIENNNSEEQNNKEQKNSHEEIQEDNTENQQNQEKQEQQNDSKENKQQDENDISDDNQQNQ